MFGKKIKKMNIKPSTSKKQTSSIKVILNKNVYRAIIASCVRFGNARIPEEDWAEVMGILIGRNEGNTVIVSSAYPMTHTMEKRHVLKVSFDSPDYVYSAMLEEEAYTHDPPEFIVGWYHSHPGIKIMFSQDDIKNQLSYQQNNPKAIGLVFNHVRLMRQIQIAERKGEPSIRLHNDPGFKIFQLSDPNRGIEASYGPVEFEFNDMEINPATIEEAKLFAEDCARLLHPSELIEKTKSRMDKALDKLKELYVGTESYIKTLIKKGETSRIQNVMETQIEQLNKVIGPMEADIQLLEEIIYYVEYKEREKLIDPMIKLFQYWKSESGKIMKKVDSLKSRF